MRISASRAFVLTLWAVAVAIPLLVTTGCDDPTAHADGSGVPPASRSGGACQHLDYGEINEILGVRFSVAAAARSGETYTCVVQEEGASYPDLTLAVTPTAADYVAFSDTANPPDSTAVEELGLVAYTSTIMPAGSAGPGIEVGWLAGNARMLVLRFRLPPSAKTQDALERTPQLIALAKRVDYTSS